MKCLWLWLRGNSRSFFVTFYEFSLLSKNKVVEQTPGSLCVNGHWFPFWSQDSATNWRWTWVLKKCPLGMWIFNEMEKKRDKSWTTLDLKDVFGRISSWIKGMQKSTTDHERFINFLWNSKRRWNMTEYGLWTLFWEGFRSGYTGTKLSWRILWRSFLFGKITSFRPEWWVVHEYWKFPFLVIWVTFEFKDEIYIIVKLTTRRT